MATKDLATQIREGIAKGEDISAILNQRIGKTGVGSGFEQYANDQTMQDAQKYMSSYKTPISADPNAQLMATQQRDRENSNAQLMAMLQSSRNESNALAEQQRQSTITANTAALGQQKDTAMSQLSTQRTGATDLANKSKVGAVTGTKMAGKRLSELIPFGSGMAGDNVRNATGLETGLQQRQTDIDTQKQAELANIATKEQQAQSVYSSGLMQARAGADATAYSQQLGNLADYNTGAFNQALTADERAYQERLTNTTNDKNSYLGTINRYSDNYQQEINNLKAQGVPDSDYRIQALQSVRQDKVVAQNNAQITADNATATAQSEQQAAQQESAYNLFKLTGRLTPDMAAILGIPENTTTADYANMMADNARMSSGGSSGGSSIGSSSYSSGGVKTDRTKALDTTQEISGFNQLKSDLQQGRAWNGEGLKYLSDNYSDLSYKYGKTVVDAVSKAINESLAPATVKAPTASEQSKVKIDQIVNDFSSYGLSPMDAVDELISNESAYVKDIGFAEYQKLYNWYYKLSNQ